MYKVSYFISKLNSEFGKNVLVLLTGTAIAQVVPILVSPILTRIYTPHEFGVFGLYMACVSILSVFSTGRYDLSIIEPRNEQVARMLLLISIYISVAFCILLFISIIIFNKALTKLLSEESISIWLYLIPTSVFTVSSMSVFTYWMNRKKLYKDMSINRVVSSSSVTVFTLFFGFTKIITGGLILGYVVGQLITVYLLKRKLLKEDYSLRLKRKYITMKKFIHYPKYLIPATLASEISGAIPIFMITTFFTSTITGFFSFAIKVTALPISFIGNAIGEVYRQKAAEEYSKFGNCKKIYISTFKKLVLIGIVPFLVLFFGSEYLFGLVFGSSWLEAGLISKYLSFLVFFQLISTPLAYTITFNKSQNLDMILQFFRAIGAALSIFLGYKFNSYIVSIILYSLVYSLYYILHSIIQYRAAIGINKSNSI